MNLLNRSKMFYFAQGFVEALIAILITGIASVLFMTIAARTIADVVHNEKVDMLTQEAVKGSIIATNIIEEWNFGNRTLTSNSNFLTVDNGFGESIGNCYGLDGDVNDPMVSNLPVCQFFGSSEIGINPSLCASDVNWEEVSIDAEDGIEDMFRIICVDTNSNETNMVLALRVYTGFRSCNRVNSIVREVSDVDISCDLYEYITVLKLEPIAE